MDQYSNKANDKYSSNSKIKHFNFDYLKVSAIICYIAMSPVATGVHFLPTHALGHN